MRLTGTVCGSHARVVRPSGGPWSPLQDDGARIIPPMRPPRRWTLLLLLYVAIDLMDPSLPGVFFFESESLFVDGAVQARAERPADLAVTEPLALAATMDRDDEPAAVKVRISLPPTPRVQSPWKHLKHDDSGSFPSSAPPDPDPLLS